MRLCLLMLFASVAVAAQPVCNVTNSQINGYVLTATQSGGHLCAWQAPTGGGGPTPPPSVASFNGRTGAVVPTTGDYTYSMVTGAAPLASPSFTGTPTAPTPGLSDNSTKIATTAFVQALVGTSSCPTCTLGTPVNHGVVIGSTGQNLSFSAVGTAGQAFLSGGASADGAYGALNLAGGSGIVTGTLPAANLPTGSAVAKGILQTDGSTISVTGGVISCTTATNSQLGCVRPDGTTVTISGGVLSAVTSGTGTVTSVALSLPAIFSVSGSPVTSAGTLTATLATQAANTVWAGPTSGPSATPTFRAIVAGDLPGTINANTTGTAAGLTAAYIDWNASSGGASILNKPTVPSFPLSIANGGNGTSSPALTAGTNVTLSGTWPNYTINATGGGGSSVGASGAVQTSNGSGGFLDGGCTESGGTHTCSTLATTGGTAGSLQLYDSGGVKSTGWAAPTSLSGTGCILDFPTADPTAGQVLRFAAPSGGHCTGTWATYAGGGSVTSVGMTVPGIFTLSGSPITSAGTFTVGLATQAANTVFAGPTTGPVAAPAFRALVAGDLPAPGGYITGASFGATRLYSDIRNYGATCNGTGQHTAVLAALNAGLTALYFPKSCVWVLPSTSWSYNPGTGLISVAANTVPAGLVIQGEDWNTSAIKVSSPTTTDINIGSLTQISNMSLVGHGCDSGTLSPGADPCPNAYYSNADTLARPFISDGWQTMTLDGSANTDQAPIQVRQYGTGDAIYSQAMYFGTPFRGSSNNQYNSTVNTGAGGGCGTGVDVCWAGGGSDFHRLTCPGDSQCRVGQPVWINVSGTPTRFLIASWLSNSHITINTSAGNNTGVDAALSDGGGNIFMAERKNSSAGFYVFDNGSGTLCPSVCASDGIGYYYYSAIRTTGQLLRFDHTTSAFTGDAIALNMGGGSGSFTGKYLNFANNGTTRYTIDYFGKAGCKSGGSDAVCGVNFLSGGHLTISTTAIGPNDSIEFYLQSCLSCGTVYLSSFTSGSGFALTSTNASDASQVFWRVATRF